MHRIAGVEARGAVDRYQLRQRGVAKSWVVLGERGKWEAIPPEERRRAAIKKRRIDTAVNNVNRHVLKPVCGKLKILIGTTRAFRHGRVSVLQQNNIPGDLIRKWVGRTNLKTTSRYTHFPREYRRKVVSELARTPSRS